jgi:hypothetical protein
MIERGWCIGTDLPAEVRSKFLRAMIKGSIVETGPMDCTEEQPGMSPVMDNATWNTRAKIRRLYDKYRRGNRPAVTVPPEPADFFEQVQLITRSFCIISGDPDTFGWTSRTIMRAGSRNPGWVVGLSDGGKPPMLSWSFAVAADLKRWPDVRERVSPAWDEALGYLGYCLWCMETKEDPLHLWPRFKGGKVTTQTLTQCLKTAKHYAKACWHMANNTPRAWEYI